ncbi:MAG: hypothetical protein FJ405_07820 [Verrucomicrobia bacterium]|nr:hypothetical protein [Verrucomicrobiota bacterium]
MRLGCVQKAVRLAVGGMLAGFLFAGCSSSSTGKPVAGLSGDPIADGHRMMEAGKPEDRLLWGYRGAAAAMRRGQYSDAKRFLDEAVDRLNGMLGRDRTASKARSAFYRESKKTFYGEPYERAMAFYYRGILYWMDGEPDNARACFRSAQLADSDLKAESFSGDYVIMDYLDGLASLKLGADGADAFKRATARPRIAIPPAYDKEANVLFFVEFGMGPAKVAGGEYGELLQYRLGNSPVQSVRIRAGNYDVEAGPYDDLNFQATTRGGRAMDRILERKADVKRSTDAIGDAAIISGAVVGATSRDNEEAAFGLLAAGLVSKIFSAVTKPEADTRAWDNLPLFLTFAAIRLPEGRHSVSVEFLDAARKPVATFSKQLQITVPPAGRDKVVFVSDQSATPQNL